MKLIASKFNIALGLAFAVEFLCATLFFCWFGDNFSLTRMNLIFHKTDFKPIMIAEGFNMGKLLGGIEVLFPAEHSLDTLQPSYTTQRSRNKLKIDRLSIDPSCSSYIDAV
jgi:hypothetical protein